MRKKKESASTSSRRANRESRLTFWENSYRQGSGCEHKLEQQRVELAAERVDYFVVEPEFEV